MKTLFGFVLVLGLLISCGGGENTVRYSETVSAQGDGFIRGGATFKQTSQVSQTNVERKLIKNGSMDFEVRDVDATKKVITEMTAKVGGYISSDSQNDFVGSPRFEQTVRIPADTLDYFMKEIEKLATRIDHRNVSTNDVTEEFIDVETRLRTKKELEARYLDLLKQAKNLKDVVEIEGQLSNVRGEIESMEGRLKYLSNQVDYSTLRVNYYNPTKGDYGFGSRFSNTFGKGWKLLLDFVIFIFTMWPFVIMGAIGTWFFIRRRRRRNERVR